MESNHHLIEFVDRYSSKLATAIFVYKIKINKKNIFYNLNQDKDYLVYMRVSNDIYIYILVLTFF